MSRRILVIGCLAAIGWATSAQTIRVDVASGLQPLLDAAIAEVKERRPEVDAVVGLLGLDGGFDLLCRGEIDIVGSGRRISGPERAACQEAGVEPVETALAYDWVTVVTNEGSEWLECLTSAELARLWNHGSQVRSWSDLRPEWPDREIALFAPGVGSGTYQVFSERVLKGGPLRTDFYPASDEAQVALQVAGSDSALAFLSHSQYLRAEPDLAAVAIDFGLGCVVPDLESLATAAEPPLLRIMYLYTVEGALDRSAVASELLEILLSPAGRELMSELGYRPFPAVGAPAAP